MSSYTGTADRPDRAKAVVAVAAVHVALAAAILTGLNVRMVGHAVEVLKTFNIREPPPPPPEPPPPPQPKPKQAKLDEGAAGKKAKPTPVVAPKPRIPVPSPIPARRSPEPAARRAPARPIPAPGPAPAAPATASAAAAIIRASPRRAGSPGSPTANIAASPPPGSRAAPSG